MEHFSRELLLFFVGSVAGFVNVSAGGGSALTLPVLIFAGLDTATANGTNRIALILQNISGISSFKNQKITGFNIALKYALFTIPGAVAGAIFSIKITQEWFERILAVIMIAIIFTLFKKQELPNDSSTENKKPGPFFYIAMFLVGFYGGFIQVGVGFILMGALFYFLKTSLIRVNYYKLVIVLVYMIPAMLVFLFNNKINWTLGIIMALGNMTGAWIGAHANVKKGDKFIKYILSVAILFMAIKLFL
jgi:uncharacterized protein